jgi:L-fuconolactonase
MTIDSHHHFWNYSAEEYAWIGDGMDALKTDYAPADLKPQLDEAGIDGVVSVQARTDEKENRFLLDYAKANDWILGVVGWIDLNRPDIGDALAHYAGKKKLVAMRHVLQGEADDRYCLRADFNRGIAALHDHGLAYDILIKQHQLPAIPEFVDRHPGLTFVVDHIAKPVIASATPDKIWLDGMTAVAERDHVFCKVSGMVTEVAEGLDATPDLMRPYFDHVLQAFGTDRLMFGSDWPVCRLGIEYVDWAKTVRSWISELSADEQAAILGNNTKRAYQLKAS